MRSLDAVFIKSAARLDQCPDSTLPEFAVIGRSNVGKSSVINLLTNQSHLAKASSTPGKTQLINFFLIDSSWYLVDLPGYGYAKVALQVKLEWQKNLAHYLEVRESLKGLVLLMDIRHPLKDLDQMMIDWALNRELPVHILLTKADKLSRSEVKNCVLKVRKHYDLAQHLITVQSFSSLKKEGVDELISLLNQWFE